MVSQVELSPRRPRRPKTPKCPKPSVGWLLRCRTAPHTAVPPTGPLVVLSAFALAIDGCVYACTDAAISPPRATCNSRGRTLVMSVFAPTLNKLTPASEPATSLEAGKRWLDGWEGEFSRQFNVGSAVATKQPAPRETPSMHPTLYSKVRHVTAWRLFTKYYIVLVLIDSR